VGSGGEGGGGDGSVTAIGVGHWIQIHTITHHVPHSPVVPNDVQGGVVCCNVYDLLAAQHTTMHVIVVYHHHHHHAGTAAVVGFVHH